MTKRQRHFMVGEPRPHVGSEHQMWVGDCKCGETCLPAPNRLSAIIFVKNHALTATQKELAALQEKFDKYRDGVEAAETDAEMERKGGRSIAPFPALSPQSSGGLIASGGWSADSPALIPGIPWSSPPLVDPITPEKISRSSGEIIPEGLIPPIQPTSVESPPEKRGDVEGLCVIALSPYLMEGFEEWLTQRQMTLSAPLPDGDGRELQVVLPAPHVWESLVNNPRDDDE